MEIIAVWGALAIMWVLARVYVRILPILGRHLPHVIRAFWVLAKWAICLAVVLYLASQPTLFWLMMAVILYLAIRTGKQHS